MLKLVKKSHDCKAEVLRKFCRDFGQVFKVS